MNENETKDTQTNKPKKEFINKDKFIRIFANELNYTLTETRDILDTFIVVLSSLVAQRKTIRIRGLGKIDYYPIKARKAYVPTEEKFIDCPEGEKIIFTLSDYIKNGVLEEDAEDDELEEDI